MKKLFLILSVLSISTISFAQKGAESLKRTTAAQLSEMIITDIEFDKPVSCTFTFNNCDLNMRALVNGEDAKFKVDVVWDMAKSTHVFYEIEDEPNRYEVHLGVPADGMNIRFSLGEKLTINADLDDTDIDDFEELSVSSNNRREVDDLVFRLNKIASGCKGI